MTRATFPYLCVRHKHKILNVVSRARTPKNAQGIQFSEGIAGLHPGPANVLLLMSNFFHCRPNLNTELSYY